MRALGVKEPKEGKDIHLTVDAKLQSYVQELLGPQRGAVVVMRIKDGGILSLNSAPSFDSNLFSSKKGRKEVGKYLRGEGSPMVGIRTVDLNPLESPDLGDGFKIRASLLPGAEQRDPRRILPCHVLDRHSGRRSHPDR